MTIAGLFDNGFGNKVPGLDIAGLAATRRLGVALDLCLRGNADRAVLGDISRGLFCYRAGAQRGLFGPGRRRLFCLLP